MMYRNIGSALIAIWCLVLPPSSAAGQTDRWERYSAEAAREYRQGHYAEAQQLLLTALREAEGFGASDQRVATTLNHLGEIYAAQGQYTAAEPLFKRALPIWEKVVLGPDAPGLTRTVNNLAAVYQAQGQYAAAEALYQRALANREKALGPEHPNVAGSLNNLAQLYVAQGRYSAAAPLYQRALAIKEKALGAEHPAIASNLEKYAALMRRMNRETEAAAMEARVTAIQVKLQERPAENLFSARSVDYPDHPLWPGLDATVTEIQREDRSSLFLLTQKKGIEGGGAMGRFFFCSVSALAGKRGFGYWANSEGVEDYAETYVLAAFLRSKDEKVRQLVGDHVSKYQFPDEIGSVLVFRGLCLFKP